MGRTPTILLFVLSILVAGAGAFYAGATLTLSPSPDISTSTSILEEAKKRILVPTLPAKPAGREITETKPVQRVIQVPRQVIEPLRISGLKITPPKVTTVFDNQTITESIASTRLVDATPAEISAWESQVKKLQDTYDRQIGEEIKKISAEQFLQKSKEAAQQFKTLVSDVFLPILISLTGLVGAIFGLIQAFKLKPKDQS